MTSLTLIVIIMYGTPKVHSESFFRIQYIHQDYSSRQAKCFHSHWRPTSEVHVFLFIYLLLYFLYILFYHSLVGQLYRCTFFTRFTQYSHKISGLSIIHVYQNNNIVVILYRWWFGVILKESPMKIIFVVSRVTISGFSKFRVPKTVLDW